jgi:hypothetical protein
MDGRFDRLPNGRRRARFEGVTAGSSLFVVADGSLVAVPVASPLVGAVASPLAVPVGSPLVDTVASPLVAPGAPPCSGGPEGVFPAVSAAAAGGVSAVWVAPSVSAARPS